MKIEVQKFKDFFDLQKMRFTRGRKAIIEEILNLSNAHLDAEEIFQRLQSKGVKVSRATLYRTLALLVRGGVLKTVSLGEDHSHFELGFSEEMHGHFICIECKNVKEFNSEKIKEILEKLSKKTEFSIKSIEIQVFGICKKHKK